MDYVQFKNEVYKWAKLKNIDIEEGSGDYELAVLYYKGEPTILLCKNHFDDELFVEFRMGNAENGFHHLANIRSISSLEKVLWQFHPFLLQGK